MREERKLVKDFDKDGDKRLNATERKAALEFMKKEIAEGRAGRRFPGFPGGRSPGGGPGNPGGPGNGSAPGANAPAPAGPPGNPGAPGPDGPRTFMGPPPGMEASEPAKPGPRVAPSDVKPSGVSALYAPDTLRTLFLDFETPDWESEMETFHDTDVDLPATLTVDGKKYPGVGVHFRGMSSYMMVKAGHKRSLNVAIDAEDKKQRVDGYKTLNLLNSNGDDSMMSTVLYSEIARHYLPAPKANFVRTVINGESWGVFVNVQQFNQDFVQENFRTTKGARWKVSGSPMGGGGLDYLGEDVAKYKAHYQIKSKDNEEDWKAFIHLCRVLNETPIDQLEAALRPILDVDSLLWFLALDCALINTDGYWVRASDYSIYRDPEGKFHILPHDMNEAFSTPHGPGMGGGPGGMRMRRGGGGSGSGNGPGERSGNATRGGAVPPPPLEAGAPKPENAPPPNPTAAGENGRPPGGVNFPPVPGPGQNIPAVKGVELDPLVALDDARKPLRSRVLKVPALRARYLANVRTIAEQWLDWKNLGPLVAKYRALIEDEVKADTRKLGSYAAFAKATSEEIPPPAAREEAPAPPKSEAANPPPDGAPKPNGPEGEAAGPGPRRGGRGGPKLSLRAFAEQRRAYLLSRPEVKNAPATAQK